MLDWLRVLGSIILVDLVLSGDNALVIGAVAADLEKKKRWIAFVVGGGGAILIRILLTYGVTLLLDIPYLEAIGGILLLIITIRLLASTNEAQEGESTQSIKRFFQKLGFLPKSPLFIGMLTILAADATTSLDNIISIAALAHQDPPLLIIGLLLSIAFLLLASALIARLIERFPWLILLAAVILVITSAQMILQDDDLARIISSATAGWWPLAVYVISFAIVSIPIYRWIQGYVKVSLKH
ncbi:YjbE family putative metal transport protein [Ktedonosporobacter rubrisoli]|uniref:YjbE family putative metal transport protein n=1 Tax=Ktedonosporobacter rubrisoli TaxID=2509675 RepID=UPI0013EECE3F|nr:YjbE family putative metal transport protein [Ktedonosporobacter rubrisoli]